MPAITRSTKLTIYQERRVLMDERQAYREKTEAQLKELGARIQVWEAKAEQAKADAKLEYGRTMKDLLAQQNKIAGQLEQVQGASEKAWEELKAGIDSALKDLQKSVAEAAAEFE
jgi:hypothetical protein